MSLEGKEPCFIPQTRQDVTDAFVWYEQQQLGLGHEFLRCLEAAVLLIQRHPQMFPAILDDYHRALIRRFPYAIFYEIGPTRIVVYAVFHCSQDPDKWKIRLP